jgi:glyoxylase-like metal-dependent hydrolase (beta-lactamase superfamily II)
LNTYGHGDHIAGNQKVIDETGAKLLIHQLDQPYLSDPYLNLSAYFGREILSPPPYRLLQDGDSICLGEIKFQVLHTPGHTPGHISLWYGKHAFVGDVIFQGSIGRTDIPNASGQQLIQSIRRRIYSLPDLTVLYPGHGPNTTVKAEKESNPFVSD